LYCTQYGVVDGSVCSIDVGRHADAEVEDDLRSNRKRVVAAWTGGCPPCGNGRAIRGPARNWEVEGLKLRVDPIARIPERDGAPLEGCSTRGIGSSRDYCIANRLLEGVEIDVRLAAVDA